MGFRSLMKIGAAIGVVVLSVSGGNPFASVVAHAADRAGEERRVPHVDSRTWRKLQQVQDLIKSEEYADATSTLETMVSRPRRYNKNELGLMHHQLAYLYWELEQPARTIEHYEKVLDQVPYVSEAIEATTLHMLAKLYYLEGEHHADEPGNGWYYRALSAMESYLAIATDPDPQAHYFVAQTHYTLKDYEAGIESLETAIRVAEERGIPVRENWTRLLEYMRWSTDAEAG